MRNDARPIGEEIGRQAPVPEDRSDPDRDPRDSVTHGRQSHIVNKKGEDEAHRRDADVDPVMPTGDSSLRTRI